MCFRRLPVKNLHLKAFHINGQFPNLEAKALQLWQKFCLKSEPLQQLGGKTVSDKISIANEYWNKAFKNNLCLYDGNISRIAIYGFDEKWFTASKESKKLLSGQKFAVLIMGASINNSLSEVVKTINWTKETFSYLRENFGIEKIVWNANRVKKKTPFLRFLSSIGENKGEYWQAL